MKGMNVQKCTLCVCVLTLILVCVLVFRNVNEGFDEYKHSDVYYKYYENDRNRCNSWNSLNKTRTDMLKNLQHTLYKNNNALSKKGGKIVPDSQVEFFFQRIGEYSRSMNTLLSKEGNNYNMQRVNEVWSQTAQYNRDDTEKYLEKITDFLEKAPPIVEINKICEPQQEISIGNAEGIAEVNKSNNVSTISSEEAAKISQIAGPVGFNNHQFMNTYP